MYITYTDVGNFLNININSNGQTVVNPIIAAVEAYVNRACNRVWNNGASTDIIEKFDGKGQDKFFPKQVPIASITSITVDGNTLNASDIYNYSTYIRLASPVISLPQGVVITYRSSATAIPDDLKFGLIMWAAQLFKSYDDAGKVASRVTTGAGISVDYITKDGVPAFMEELIQAYRIPNI